MKKWSLLSIVLCSLVAIGCHKGGKTVTPPACPDFEEPNPFIFELKKGSNCVTDKTYLGEISISFTDNGATKSVADLIVSDTIATSDGVVHREVTSTNMALSSAFGTKTYFVQYPDTSKIDTLYLDVVRTPATNCEYVFNYLTINNVIAKTDSLLVEGGDSSYIINHP